jgi:hypothetical protein
MVSREAGEHERVESGLTTFLTTRDNIIEKDVKEFQINLRSKFEPFLKENVQLPLWQPPLHLAGETRRHITGLKIPIISSSSQFPLLLLHNLGQPSHDAYALTRFFVRNSRNTFPYAYSEISR